MRRSIGLVLLIPYPNIDKNIVGTYSAKDIQFAFAAEIGYVFNRLELSLRYLQSGASPYQMAFLGARVTYVIRGNNY